MYRLISIVAGFALLAACSHQNDTTRDAKSTMAKTTKHSGLVLDNMNTSVRPGDDFMAYVNGGWIDRTEIPADKASYGIGYVLHETAQENVKKIIEESSSGQFAEGSDEQKVGDLYNSFMNIERRNELGLSPLVPELNRINALSSHDDVAAYFGHANQIGLSLPFQLTLFADLKKPTHYAMYTFQGGLGLPDRDYYFNEGEKSESLRIKYREHMTKMMFMTDLGDANDVNAVYELEKALADKQMKKEQTRDIVNLYNPRSRSELKALAPDFNWDTYLAASGLKDHPRLVVAMVDYTRDFNDIFKNTDVATWKKYLTWAALRNSSRRLTADIDDENFDFYRRTLSGAQQQTPMWRRGVNVVNATLGEVVGKVYVKRHFPPAAKTEMQTLVQNLIKAYGVSIKDLDWMGEATRVEALDKLSKFTPKIGYPDVWKNYDSLTVDANDLYGNLERSNKAEYARSLAKLGGPVDKNEWGMTPQTVNAYYNPPQNEIVFPAAILQPPYFDLTSDDAVNYGAIGAVIGHEIGHGFDDAGSTFDGDGVLRDWWTDEDKAEFEKRTSRLVDQYNEFKVFDDLNVNGEFTLGENIGDLGGLSIALKAYKMSLNGKPAPVMDGFTGEQRVFIGYAQAWLRKSREEAVRQQVGTDPHSPVQFRVNGVVRNVPEFYSAFDVKPSDDLYLPPKERVKIW
ncbi:MAG: M13 family metallopeptidase [Gammaproteobacteria bacterium]